jgi:hypothetical protein
MELATWTNEQLTNLAERMQSGGSDIDDFAVGSMSFYAALRRVISGEGSPHDVGIVDAVNDTLQQLGLIEPGTTFYRAQESA